LRDHPEFDTKVAIVVRDDLAAWPAECDRVLMTGIVAVAGAEAIGEEHIDGDGCRYLPLPVQPVLVFEAPGGKLRTMHERAARREVPVAIYTADMFATATPPSRRVGRPRPSPLLRGL
jgi:hypothetical protein